MTRPLGRQSLDHPVFDVFAQPVAEPIVEAVFPSLPEFEHQRDDPISTPVRRAGNGAIAVVRRKLFEPLIECAASGDDSTLLGGPGAELTSSLPGGEVAVRLFLGHVDNRPFDAYLTFHRLPPEDQRSSGIVM